MRFSKRRQYFNMSSERVVATIYSEPCPATGTEAVRHLTAVFENLVADPRLMQCDEKIFDICRIAHDGNSWVMTMEALVPRKDFQV